MRLYISLENSGEAFEVDFIAEVAVPTPDLYLLTYKFDTYRYIIKGGGEPDIRTDNYSEFHLTQLNHIIYGHFFYDNKKIGAQIGGYVRRIGVPGFVTVLLSHDFGDKIFVNGISEIFFNEASLMIIDLEDFNKTRTLIGQTEYSLMEYISKRLSKVVADENGLTLNEETSLFSVLVNKFDPSDIMTSKGMTIFLEEQLRK